MIQSNNNSSDPSARLDNVQKQMQTTAQLELFKGHVANSFDLGRSGDKTHQQSAVPMTGKGCKKMAVNVVNKLSQALLKQDYLSQVASTNNVYTSNAPSGSQPPTKAVLNTKSSKNVTAAPGVNAKRNAFQMAKAGTLDAVLTTHGSDENSLVEL